MTQSNAQSALREQGQASDLALLSLAQAQPLPSLSQEQLRQLPSPCYLIDEPLLKRNLEILQGVRQRTGAKILLAQKAYSAFQTYPLIAEYLDGTTASGLYEARLGAEEMPGREVHVFSPAYSEAEMEALLPIAGHIVFNSWSQWLAFRDRILALPATDRPSCGLRINPGYSEVETALYDPCAEGSRLGMTLDRFQEGYAHGWFEGLEGLHFHCLCEQDAGVLERVWQAVTASFGFCFPHIRWINFGGGHHITRPGYQMEILERVIGEARALGLDVYLEPGEAVALRAGFLCAEVRDVVPNGLPIAILDTSATCHMPDVLEMPYRPQIFPLYQESVDRIPPGFYVPDAPPVQVPAHTPKPFPAQSPRTQENREHTSAPACMDPAVWQRLTLERQTACLRPWGELAGEQITPKQPYLYRLGGPTCLAGDVIGDYSFPAPLLPGDRLVFCDMAIYSFVKTTLFNGMPLPHLLLAHEDGSIETLQKPDYSDFRNRL